MFIISSGYQKRLAPEEEKKIREFIKKMKTIAKEKKLPLEYLIDETVSKLREEGENTSISLDIHKCKGWKGCRIVAKAEGWRKEWALPDTVEEIKEKVKLIKFPEIFTEDMINLLTFPKEVFMKIKS